MKHYQRKIEEHKLFWCGCYMQHKQTKGTKQNME